MVLTPAGSAAGADAAGSTGGETPPTWVFPFDRPAPPQDGDNQALAVNTEDGSVQYDVSFALVWADEDAVLNKNEAYAFASCRDCRTVAVAFQVVLVVGSVDVVVPQNLSAAVNYACVECVTYALATQLVVTVPGALDDAGMQELAAIWAELQEFGAQIDGVPLADLRSRLSEFEERILAVVRENAPGADGGTSADPSTGDGAPSEGSSADGGGAESTATPDAGGGDPAGSSAGPTSTGAATSSDTTPTNSSEPATSSSAAAGTTAASTSTVPAG
jgi:putative peptide zinc metalloprotease protein